MDKSRSDPPTEEPIPPAGSNSLYRIHFDLEQNCVFSRHFHKLTVDLILQRFEDIFVNPLMRPNLNYFLDYSDITDKITTDGLREVAVYLQSKRHVRGTCKNAVIANTTAGHGMIRMLDSLYNAGLKDDVGRVTTNIFNLEKSSDPENTKREAKVWLGIDPGYKLPF